MNVNFFWSGDSFDYLNYLTIKSHILVKHNVILWLYGSEPQSKYWNMLDFDNIILNNANDVFDISEFLNNKDSNIKTASDLWRFHFLYKYGGWYSDCDAFALKHWPDNIDYMLCSAEIDEEMLSIGVIKTPAKEKMFPEIIKNIKYDWGNVKLFDTTARKYYKNLDNKIYNQKMFYPYNWKEYYKLLTDTKTPNSYSVHFYNTMFYKDNTINNMEKWSNDKTTLLYKLKNMIL